MRLAKGLRLVCVSYLRGIWGGYPSRVFCSELEQGSDPASGRHDAQGLPLGQGAAGWVGLTRTHAEHLVEICADAHLLVELGGLGQVGAGFEVEDTVKTLAPPSLAAKDENQRYYYEQGRQQIKHSTYISSLCCSRSSGGFTDTHFVSDIVQRAFLGVLFLQLPVAQ